MKQIKYYYISKENFVIFVFLLLPPKMDLLLIVILQKEIYIRFNYVTIHT